jgi:hypothetical protein
MVELAELDPTANATDRRAASDADRPVASEGVPTTAADLAFAQDFRPLVDPEGGFPEQHDPHDEENDT